MNDAYHICRKHLYKYNIVNDLFTERGTPYKFTRLDATKPYFVIMGNSVRAEKTLDVDIAYDNKDAIPSCADCSGRIEWESEEDLLDKIRDFGEIVTAGQRYGKKYIQDIGCCVGCGSLYFDQGARDRFEKEHLDNPPIQDDR